jgi:hypothetical protein
MKKLQVLFIISLVLITAGGCKKTVGTPSATIQPTDYLQLQVGKYVTYRLDSLQFVNFGSQDTIVSYQAMDVVDTLITDNLGRPSWRVIRYLSDTTGTAPWVPDITYMVTVTKQDVEVVENNLRFIKLVYPVSNGYNWSGNSYIDVTSDTFNVLTYMQGWNYTYDSVGLLFNTLGGTVANSLTVIQEPDITNGDFSDPTRFSERDYSTEVYGKGIGLIYKSFLHQEYQPPNGGSNSGSNSGYGLTLNMIDHN